MAEDKFRSNTRSPRFSTEEAAGFGGGSVDPNTGNLTPGSFTQQAGAQPKPPQTTTTQPGISAFPSATSPRPPDVAKQLALQAGAKVAGNVLQQGVQRLPGLLAGSSIGPIQNVDDANLGIFFGDQTVDLAPIEDVTDLGAFFGDQSTPADFLGAVETVPDAELGTFFGDQTLTDAGSAVGDFFGGGCFITEATMAALGVMDDNAEPLQILRNFRDQILMMTPQGQQLVQEYEAIAPLVVEGLSQHPQSDKMFGDIYMQFLAPAVEAVKMGDYQQALQIYAQMIQAVTPYAAAGAGGMPEQQAMQGMAQDAGQVAQDPGAAGAAIGQFQAQPQAMPTMAQNSPPMLPDFDMGEEELPMPSQTMGRF